MTRLNDVKSIVGIWSGFAISGMLLLADGNALAGMEPFMDIGINASNVLAVAVDKMPAHPEETNKDAGQVKGEEPGKSMPDIMPLLKTLDVGMVHLYLYAGTANQVLPVLYCREVNRQAFEALLSGKGALAPFVEKEKDGCYRIKDDMGSTTGASGADTKKDEEKAESPLPVADYRIWIQKTGIIIAPISVATNWNKGSPSPLATPVSKLTSGWATDGTLATLAVNMPEPVEDNLDEKLEELPGAGSKGGQMVQDIGMKLFTEIGAPLKKIKALAFKLDASTNEIRHADYEQWFRDPANAAEAYAKLQGTNATGDANGIVSTLLGVARGLSVTNNLKTREGSITMAVSWSRKDDQKVIGAMMGMALSMAMGGNMKVTMGEAGAGGQVETKYTTTPRIDKVIDPAKLEETIRKALSSGLYPDNYWGNGDEPTMMVQIDSLDIPNSALVSLTYRVKSVTAPNGADLLRVVDESHFPNKIDLDSEFWHSVTLPIKKGIPAERLEKALVTFSVEAPLKLAVFDFKTNEVGVTREVGGIKATLKECSCSAVSVELAGGEAIHIFASDGTGRFLESSSSCRMDNNASASFCGTATVVKVVVVESVKSFAFDIPIALNKGKGVEFPSGPSDTVPARYRAEPEETYITFSETELAALKVGWADGSKFGKSGFTGNLEMSVPSSKKSFGEDEWKVSFFGKDKPLDLDGNGGWTPGTLYYNHHGDRAEDIYGALGSVDITVPMKIVHLTAKRTAGQDLVELRTPSGMKVGVSFIKNQIAVKGPSGQILGIEAVDNGGRWLKQESRSGYQNDLTFAFWGQPAQVVVSVVDKQLHRRIPVEIIREGVDPKAWEAFKKSKTEATLTSQK